MNNRKSVREAPILSVREALILWAMFALIIVFSIWIADHTEHKERIKCSNGLEAAHTVQDTLLFLQHNSMCLRFIKVSTQTGG